MICSDVQTITMEGEKLREPVGPDADISKLGWRSIRLGISGVVGAACAWSAEVYRVFGPITEERAYEDQVMIARSLCIGRIAHVPEPTVQYRIGGISNWHGKSSAQYAALKVRKMTSHVAVMRQRIADIRIAHPDARPFIKRLQNKVVSLTTHIAKLEAEQRLPRLAASPRWSVVDLPRIADARGDLTVIEGGSDIPFDIARVYYLYNVPVNAARGGHAHRRLRQVVFALSGSFRMKLDDGTQAQTVTLRDPSVGLLIEPFTWREIDQFSQGAVLMVMASEVYDEAEYIRGYAEFRQLVAERAAAGLT